MRPFIRALVATSLLAFCLTAGGSLAAQSGGGQSGGPGGGQYGGRGMSVGPVLSGDPTETALRVLRSQMTKLQNRVDALQNTVEVSGIARNLTYRCVDRDSSINSLNVTEQCDPYGCDSNTGRCRTSAVMNSHCSTGAIWDGGLLCVYPR